MIARVKRPTSHRETSARHAEFSRCCRPSVIPLRSRFGRCRLKLRHDLIQEVVANSYVAFARLVERRQADRGIGNAVGPLCDCPDPRRAPRGKPVADRQPRCQPTPSIASSFSSQRLDHFSEEDGCWGEILVEDKRATPADVAAWRIDPPSPLRLPASPAPEDCPGTGRRREHKQTAKMFACQRRGSRSFATG